MTPAHARRRSGGANERAPKRRRKGETTIRKLPQIGDTVAYTRDFIANVPARADWRDKIIRAYDFATKDWPVVEVEWARGPAKGETSNVNARNLCEIKSVAFIESSVPVHPAS